MKPVPEELPAGGDLPPSNARVLIVDAYPPALQALTDCLHGLGHAVCAAVASGEEAAGLAGDLRPQLALIGLGADQGAGGGVEAAERVGRRFDVPFVYLPDATVDDALLYRARLTAPCGYVAKPVDPRQLRLSIDAALCAHARERTLAETVAELRRRVLITETVVDCMGDAALAVDTAGHILTANPTARQLTGRSRENGDVAYWFEHYEFLRPDERTSFPVEALPLMRALRGESSDHVEIVVHPRGTDRFDHYIVTARPLLDPAGRAMGGVVVFHDSTPAKATKERLQESLDALKRQQRLMDAVVNGMSDGVVAVDANGDYLVVNEAARRMVGDIDGAPAPIAQRPKIYGIYRADGVTLCPLAELPTWRAMHGERMDNVELCIRPQGRTQPITIAVNGRPLPDESGIPQGGVIVMRDVSVFKDHQVRLQQATVELHRHAELMDTIFKSMSDGVTVVDEHGKFTLFNASAERMVGIGKTDAEPSEWSERYGVFRTDRVTRVSEADLPLVRALRGESTNDFELFIRNGEDPGWPLHQHQRETVARPRREGDRRRQRVPGRDREDP